MSSKKPIYLDNQATTPIDPRVAEEMMPFIMHEYGNPHSSTHTWGINASDAVEKARIQIADSIGADPSEVIFTSGATESNNLALKGIMEFYSQLGKNHLVISNIEHKCILSTAKYLKDKGFELTILEVDDKGFISPEAVKNAIKENTALVSIMWANNEIGVVQDIAKIGEICREKGVFFHTDAAQALGKVEINVKESKIDLLSLSSHKIYGPKGIGALYVGKKPRVKLIPQIHGGGQERGMRSGTLAPFLCIGFGKAAELSQKEREKDYKHAKDLRDYFYSKVNSALPKIFVNGDMEKRLPGNINISFAGVEGEGIMLGLLDKIAVSSGSACTSDSLEGSYVVKALGVTEDLAHTSIRFGFGRFSVKEDADKAAESVIHIISKLREMSPIWDMLEEGIDLDKVEWNEH